MSKFVLGQGGPVSTPHCAAITQELVRLSLGGRGPQRPELVMTARDWAEVFATRQKREHMQKKKKKRARR